MKNFPLLFVFVVCFNNFVLTSDIQQDDSLKSLAKKLSRNSDLIIPVTASALVATAVTGQILCGVIFTAELVTAGAIMTAKGVIKPLDPEESNKAAQHAVEKYYR